MKHGLSVTNSPATSAALREAEKSLFSQPASPFAAPRAWGVVLIPRGKENGMTKSTANSGKTQDSSIESETVAEVFVTFAHALRKQVHISDGETSMAGTSRAEAGGQNNGRRTRWAVTVNLPS